MQLHDEMDLLPAWAREVLPEAVAAATDELRPRLRAPSEVLTPRAMRAMCPTRLSFANTLVERMTTNRWSIRRTHCDVDREGLGFLAYEIEAEDTMLHFGAFAYPPLPIGHQRLFRDNKSDFFGALVAGPVDVERLTRERAQFDQDVWRGRTDPRVYGWTVASRGTRTFGDAVDHLASGRQPDIAELDDNGGYLIRNGGFYGNGRMGTRAWQSYALDDGPLSMPYHVDLFTLYMWRLLSFDLVDAAARTRNPKAARLAPEIKRYLGIGNSSGLGTVAALVRWPARLSACITTREIAFAYLASRPDPPSEEQRNRLASLVARAERSYAGAVDPPPGLIEPRHDVARALGRIRADVAAMTPGSAPTHPWADLLGSAPTYGSPEAVEIVRAQLLELYPETAELRSVTAAGMARDCYVEPEMTVGDLRRLIETHAGWTLRHDPHDPRQRAYFWYRSEENGENRRGERAIDVGVERETFIDVAGTTRQLYDSMTTVPESTRVGRLLLDHPEHTLGVARAQLAISSPYSELQAVVCGEDFTPSDAIRCFLSILGIELATPHNARWVRGVFYRGAPLPRDLEAGEHDSWTLPVRPDPDPSAADSFACA